MCIYWRTFCVCVRARVLSKKKRTHFFLFQWNVIVFTTSCIQLWRNHKNKLLLLHSIVFFFSFTSFACGDCGGPNWVFLQNNCHTHITFCGLYMFKITFLAEKKIFALVFSALVFCPKIHICHCVLARHIAITYAI